MLIEAGEREAMTNTELELDRRRHLDDEVRVLERRRSALAMVSKQHRSMEWFDRDGRLAALDALVTRAEAEKRALAATADGGHGTRSVRSFGARWG